MRDSGRPGRGERGRIAAQVRSLLGEADPSRPAVPVDAWLPGDWDVLGEPRPSARPGPAATAATAAARWQPDRRAVTAAAVAVVIAALVTAWWVFTARPRHLAVLASPAAVLTGSNAPSGGAGALSVASVRPAATGTGSSGGTAARLVVDVAGKVRHPGVYRLSAGSRVVDAVRAAGGPRRGVSTTSLNLAAPLQDGEQVLVGGPAQPGAPPQPVGADSGSADPGTSGPVDLNTATLAQLETLPGVGPVLAQRILDWRTEHGGFTSVEQLDGVSGIGPAKFAQLRNAVTL